MKKQIKKSEEVSVNRFSVLLEKEEVLNTNDREEATKIINDLQLKSNTLIILLNHNEKSSVQFKKTMHQKNYRIIQGDYEKDAQFLKIPSIEEIEVETAEEVKE